MKKLLIIVFVVISAVAAAATIKNVNTVDEAKAVPVHNLETPSNAKLATWD